jgi:hypothetical protein
MAGSQERVLHGKACPGAAADRHWSAGLMKHRWRGMPVIRSASHVRFIVMAPQSFCVRKCKRMKMPVGKREYDRFSRLIGIWRARRV